MNPLFLPPTSPAAPALSDAMKAHIEAARSAIAAIRLSRTASAVSAVPA